MRFGLEQRSLVAFAILAVAGALTPAGGSASAGPGRLLSSSGVAYGGIVELNTDGSSIVNLTSNTFNQATNAPDGRYKSDYASVASNGTTAFASNRGGQGWRIYVMDADGGRLRQVTFSTNAPKGDTSGQYADDILPVISPHGDTIAFVSNRSGYGMHPQQSASDIYLVNVNGSGFRRLTRTELLNGSSATIRGLVWSPDGSTIAFRGSRLAPDSNGNVGLHDVLGTIDRTGAHESDTVIDDCAGGGMVDWSGSTILYSYGGSVQGCPVTQYVLRNATTGGGTTIPDAALGNLPPIGPGSARLSPDGQRIVYTLTNGNQAELTSISAAGKDRRGVAVGLPPGAWLWWAPGAAIPKPAKLTITPAAILLRVGGKSVQAQAALLDAHGHVISRSAGDWAMDGLNAGSPVCTTTGLLIATKGTSPQTTALHATNAGLNAEAKLTVK